MQILLCIEDLVMPGKRRASKSFAVRDILDKNSYKLLKLELRVNVQRVCLEQKGEEKVTKTSDGSAVGVGTAKKHSRRIDQYFSKTLSYEESDRPNREDLPVSESSMETLHNKLLILEEELCKKNAMINELREENSQFQMKLKTVTDNSSKMCENCSVKGARKPSNDVESDVSLDESLEILKECRTIAKNGATYLNKVKIEPIITMDSSIIDNSAEVGDGEELQNALHAMESNFDSSKLYSELKTNLVKQRGNLKKNPIDNLSKSLSAWLTKAKDLDSGQIKQDSDKIQGIKRRRDVEDDLPMLKLKPFASLCAKKKNIIC